MEKDITPNSPKSVFKFYSLTDYNLDAFLNHYLFTSHPYHLNDLMDNKGYTIDMRNVTEELYEALRQQIVHQAPLIVNAPKYDQLSFETDRNTNILQKAIYDSFFCFGGIISLSTQDRFNELMWSHYTNDTGFMIEFDTRILLNSIYDNILNRSINQLYFRPIQYKKYLQSISCFKNPNIQYINLYNSTQKLKDWSYENEWRIIATSYQFLGVPKSIYEQDPQYTDTSKRKLFYSPNAIKRIFLGKKFWTIENIDQEIISESNNDFRTYIVKEKLKQFIYALCNGTRRQLYMSGACDCSEFRHGTDNIGDSYDPDHYYLTRSFEQIKNININGQVVNVEYEGIVKTQNEDFE